MDIEEDSCVCRSWHLEEIDILHRNESVCGFLSKKGMGLYYRNNENFTVRCTPLIPCMQELRQVIA